MRKMMVLSMGLTIGSNFEVNLLEAYLSYTFGKIVRMEIVMLLTLLSFLYSKKDII